ncbi:alpha/beta hydrolase [Clostridium sediminicola]|uniref:alpha/beta hydrolase n=1 Tax=Clostridium sediminicola TaxID=3114879 RepID=UPI0031F23C37
MKILLIMLFIFLVVFIIYKTVSFYYSEFVTMKVRAYDKLYQEQLSKELFDDKYYESLIKEDICITTDDGLKLKGIYFKAKPNSHKTIIIVHGITVNMATSIKYMQMFAKRGWNVLIYDHRRHGKSEGRLTTYGYMEKYDLDKWVNWVKDKEPNNRILGLHGESMGAGTVLQYAGINKFVDFIIADCGFSDLNKLVRIRMKEDYHSFLIPLISLADIRVYRKAKFKIKDISPINIIKNSSIPTLFIHGKEDRYVPTFMSVEMYEAKKNNKKLYLADGAKHADSIRVDRERYEKEVFDFINEYF